MEAPVSFPLGHDIHRVGYSVVNFEELATDNGNSNLVNHLRINGRNFAVTSQETWTSFCVDILKVQQEKIPQVDFATRSLHVIHLKVEKDNRFPCLFRVDNISTCFFMFFEFATPTWVEKAPVSVLLINSIPKITTAGDLPGIITDDLDRIKLHNLDPHLKQLIEQNADVTIVNERREKVRLALMGPRIN